jgi:hypothetical protein
MATATRKPGQLSPTVQNRKHRRREQKAAALKWREALRERRQREDALEAVSESTDDAPRVGYHGAREPLPAVIMRADELLAAEAAEDAAREEFRRVTERD